jgi:hypothetical protein
LDDLVESAWNVGEMRSKDLLALHEAIKTKLKSTGSYFLVHIKTKGNAIFIVPAHDCSKMITEARSTQPIHLQEIFHGST